MGPKAKWAFTGGGCNPEGVLKAIKVSEVPCEEPPPPPRKKIEWLPQDPQHVPTGSPFAPAGAGVVVEQTLNKAYASQKLQLTSSRRWAESHGRQVSPPPLNLKVEQLIEEWFNLVDQDSSRTLDIVELEAALKSAQVPCKPGSLEELLRLMDYNNDGVIDWQEFHAFISFEVHAGQDLLTGNLELPSGLCLPLGAMIHKIRRNLVLEKVFEGGRQRRQGVGLVNSYVKAWKHVTHDDVTPEAQYLACLAAAKKRHKMAAAHRAPNVKGTDSPTKRQALSDTLLPSTRPALEPSEYGLDFDAVSSSQQAIKRRNEMLFPDPSLSAPPLRRSQAGGRDPPEECSASKGSPVSGAAASCDSRATQRSNAGLGDRTGQTWTLATASADDSAAGALLGPLATKTGPCPRTFSGLEGLVGAEQGEAALQQLRSCSAADSFQSLAPVPGLGDRPQTSPTTGSGRAPYSSALPASLALLARTVQPGRSATPPNPRLLPSHQQQQQRQKSNPGTVSAWPFSGQQQQQQQAWLSGEEKLWLASQQQQYPQQQQHQQQQQKPQQLSDAADLPEFAKQPDWPPSPRTLLVAEMQEQQQQQQQSLQQHQWRTQQRPLPQMGAGAFIPVLASPAIPARSSTAPPGLRHRSPHKRLASSPPRLPAPGNGSGAGGHGARQSPMRQRGREGRPVAQSWSQGFDPCASPYLSSASVSAPPQSQCSGHLCISGNSAGFASPQRCAANSSTRFMQATLQQAPAQEVLMCLPKQSGVAIAHTMRLPSRGTALVPSAGGGGGSGTAYTLIVNR